MGRLLQCAVLLAASMAWAEDAAVPLVVAEEAPRHALWLHSSLDNLTAGAAVGYEHWFSGAVSLQVALGGSASQNTTATIGLGGVGLIVVGDTYAVATELQLRWHWRSGVFVAESLGLQGQRTVLPASTGFGGLSFDTASGSEAVLAGWGHTFASGLRAELFAGPRLQLASSGPSAGQMSVQGGTFGLRVGLGLGYAF